MEWLKKHQEQINAAEKTKRDKEKAKNETILMQKRIARKQLDNIVESIFVPLDGKKTKDKKKISLVRSLLGKVGLILGENKEKFVELWSLIEENEKYEGDCKVGDGTYSICIMMKTYLSYRSRNGYEIRAGEYVKIYEHNNYESLADFLLTYIEVK